VGPLKSLGVLLEALCFGEDAGICDQQSHRSYDFGEAIDFLTEGSLHLWAGVLMGQVHQRSLHTPAGLNYINQCQVLLYTKSLRLLSGIPRFFGAPAECLLQSHTAERGGCGDDGFRPCHEDLHSGGHSSSGLVYFAIQTRPLRHSSRATI
jgi:hypothetical protein